MKRLRLPRLPRPSSSLLEEAATTVLFLGGLSLVDVGVALIYVPAGLIIAGVGLAASAVRLQRTKPAGQGAP